MPLPEHEQRQLRQIEQALCRDDPKFARVMRAGDPRMHYQRKLMQALPGVVIGAGLLAAGAVTHRGYLAAAGGAVLLLSLVRAVVSWRRHGATAWTTTATGTRHRPGPARRARMMERMEQRWRRRQQGNGGMPGRTRS